MRHVWMALGLILYSQIVFAVAPVIDIHAPAKKTVKSKKHTRLTHGSIHSYQNALHRDQSFDPLNYRPIKHSVSVTHRMQSSALRTIPQHKQVVHLNPKKTDNKLNALFEKSVVDTFSVLSQEVNTKKHRQTGLQVQSHSKHEKKVVVQSKPVIFTVVIDAGHGGRDYGAKGPTGMLEKNVVLAITHQLAEKINKQPHMRAILTRHGDYFVPLRKRLALARKGDADLFVAIHADAYLNARAHGASVYALSMHGATSEAARWLAKRDNYSELNDIKLDKLADDSPMVRSVLIDLAQKVTIRDSVHVARSLLDKLNDVTKLHYKRVEQAPFMVLRSPDIPSVLIETGFISNPKEEQLLADAAYQKKIADAILQGILVYRKKIG